MVLFHFLSKCMQLCRQRRTVLAAGLMALAFTLAGCGGIGFNPQVTAIKAQSAQYSRTAIILIGGRDLRSNFVVDTQGGCTGPAFASSSTTETLVLTCRVVKVGDIPVTVSTADGALLYKGTLFHRVIPGFVAQSGGYTSGVVKKEGQNAPITLESNNGLSNLRGTVAMARTSVPNSATSEFYVNLVDNTFLDYRSAASPGYAVFGKVVQGLDAIDTIATQPTGIVNGFSDVPLTDVTISLALQVQ